MSPRASANSGRWRPSNSKAFMPPSAAATAAFTPRHRVTVSSPPLRCRTSSTVETGRGEPAGHHLVLEAEADVRVALAQLLALVRGEIDDQQRSAGREHARRLGDRRRRRVGIVKHLVDDDAVGALVGERQRIHVALAQARLDARGLELDPRQPQHLRRPVDADRPGWRAARTARSSGRCRCRCRPGGRAADVPSALSIARSTSLSATWSERIWSHISAWPVK